MTTPDMYEEEELENFPEEDLGQRLYVMLSEPTASKYGDIQLASLAGLEPARSSRYTGLGNQALIHSGHRDTIHQTYGSPPG